MYRNATAPPRPQRNRECPRLEIKYTEKNELPILQNPVRIESSHLNQMVTVSLPKTNIHTEFSPNYFTCIQLLIA